MEILVFTKPFGMAGVDEIAGEIAAAGADGVDLLVRDGESAVGPGDIVGAGRRFAAAGVPVGQVTTDLTGTEPPAEQILTACAAAGVRQLRPGFYRYDEKIGYRRLFDDARRRLAGLAEMAAAHGVRLALQTHHGTIHPSAALATALIDGLDGARLFADPGNQVKEGSEDPGLVLDLAGDRLACVGVKNAAWRNGWEWCPLADGVLHWPAILRGLSGRGYDGPLSLHVFYPGELGSALRADLAALDVGSEADPDPPPFPTAVVAELVRADQR